MLKLFSSKGEVIADLVESVFEWPSYLKESNSVAVPEAFFKHVSITQVLFYRLQKVTICFMLIELYFLSLAMCLRFAYFTFCHHKRITICNYAYKTLHMFGQFGKTLTYYSGILASNWRSDYLCNPIVLL